MIQVSWPQAAIAVMRNQAHRLTGGALRGGHRVAWWSEGERQRHAAEIFDTLSPHLGPIDGGTGVEIGPGDNLDVCARFLEAGSRKMYAVERFGREGAGTTDIELLRADIEAIELPERVDFAYSNDVFEHVNDVSGALASVFGALRPGGLFASSIDLRGHNIFGAPGHPLDFLSCPDWLYSLMFSHVVTSNRVRVHEIVKAARHAGFEVVRSDPLAVAVDGYLETYRPHFLSRYRDIPDEELRVLQLLLVLRRPEL